MADSVMISAVDWSDGSPRVRTRQNSASASELVPMGSMRLNYSIGPETVRLCVGHKPFRDVGASWVDCSNPPLHDGLKCDRCAAVDATFASQLHHAHNKARGELDAAVTRHLDQPNHLYLALFRDGSIKVGTSTIHRLEQRLNEQGAWIARAVATTADGRAVRVIEDRVSAEIGLPQAVSVKRKIDGLVRPVPDARLVDELGRWTSRVHELVADLSDPRIEITSDDWRTSNTETDVFHGGLHPYPLKLSSGAHDIELIDASGRATVLRRPGSDDNFVTDLRQLYGLVLQLGDHVPDELAVQDSLF